MTNGDIPSSGASEPRIIPATERLFDRVISEEQGVLGDLDAETDALFGSPTRSELPEGEVMFTREIPTEVLRGLPKGSPFARWSAGAVGYIPSDREDGPSALFSFTNTVLVGDNGVTRRLSIAVHFAHLYEGVVHDASYAVTDEVEKWDGQQRSVEHISDLSAEEYQAQLAVEQAFRSPGAAQEAEGLLEHPPELSPAEITVLTEIVRTMSGEELSPDE